jgi:hypothetical protein
MSIRPHNEIRSAKDIKVGGMVSYKESAIEELTQLSGSAGWLDVKQIIQGFGCCHVMGFRANAADTLSYLGHFLSRATLRKFLETSQLRNLEIGIGYTAIVVKKDSNLAMAFKAGNGINRYPLHFIIALLSSESGKL